MLHKLHPILLLFVLFLFSQCETIEPTEQDRLYFDLPAYFNSEVDRLQQNSVFAEKTLIVADSSETQLQKNVNWQKELQSFTNNDLNAVNMVEQIQVLESNPNETNYNVYTNNQGIKSVLILYNSAQQKQVKTIEIVKESENLISSSESSLVYHPTSGYEIELKQKTLFGDPYKQKLSVRFTSDND